MSRQSELAVLTSRYIDGDIEPRELDRLNELLRGDRLARREFSERLNLDSALTGSAEALLAAPAALDTTAMAGSKPSRRSKTFGVLACLALMTLAAPMWRMLNRPYAEVIQNAGTVELQEGMAVWGQHFVLKAGSVELLTSRGARLVIEAPADFQFQSAQELIFRRGRISAEVSNSAKGFTVLTPSGKAIDLGTRFGVEVSAEGSSELHVFEGQVVAQPKSGGSSQLVTTNEAIRFEKDGGGAACDMRSNSFLQASEMQQLANGLRAGQVDRNRMARDKLQQDAALLAWLDFEPTSSAASKGIVLGPRPVQGRFPGTTAVDFVDRSDRVELDLNVRVPQFTFLTWVRLNHVSFNNNSLYSTDEWGTLGQVHWMTGRNALVRFAIKSDILQPIRPGQTSPDSNIWAESRALLPERLHRWLNLAVVYDSVAGEASLFLDGRREMSASMPVGLLAALGPAQIGNWKPVPWHKDETAARRLSGRIDEFAAFSRAFTPEEIADYFEHSTPYR
ncbi:MAG TPA: LamG-like jellyroll fold domain-containing protein [Caulifigura sp.]|jgi:ferric-dicitrate binding protein FerR (iron transport regulator)|nr:LamG-like jellyroll fold domain-containing protein [Caulifigura sp.]